MFRKKIRLVLILALLLMATLAGVMHKPGGDPAIGKRIYEQGILANGEALQAHATSWAVLGGEMLSCARCHRKSGFGSFEGSIYVPPITAKILFEDQLYRREDMIRSLYHEEFSLRHWAKIRNLGQRPAYTQESLVAAIEQGIGAKNSPLDPIMPRYQLDEENRNHLLAYLRTLNTQLPIGIDQEQVHFATILTETVPESQKQILCEMIQTFADWKNRQVISEKKRASVSPNYKDAFHHTYLSWQVHFWELTGAPDSWTRQLEEYYAAQPVFAFLSGLSDQDWAPIHHFAEAHQIPSIFPNTLNPVQIEDNYNLYFARGEIGEVQSLARYLMQQDKQVFQIYDASPKGTKLKEAFEATMDSSWKAQFLKTVDLEEVESLSFEGVQTIQAVPLLCWISDAHLSKLQIPDQLQTKGSLYLTHLQQKNISAAARSFSQHYSYPYRISADKSPRNHRVRAWMRSRGLKILDEKLQMNTYFALTLTDFAIHHLVGNFSRDYLIERIEHEAENNLSPGIYPHLSLGPGQRFASRKNYIIADMGDSLVVKGFY